MVTMLSTPSINDSTVNMKCPSGGGKLMLKALCLDALKCYLNERGCCMQLAMH